MSSNMNISWTLTPLIIKCAKGQFFTFILIYVCIPLNNIIFCMNYSDTGAIWCFEHCFFSFIFHWRSAAVNNLCFFTHAQFSSPMCTTLGADKGISWTSIGFILWNWSLYALQRNYSKGNNEGFLSLVCAFNFLQ